MKPRGKSGRVVLVLIAIAALLSALTRIGFTGFCEETGYSCGWDVPGLSIEASPSVLMSYACGKEYSDTLGEYLPQLNVPSWMRDAFDWAEGIASTLSPDCLAVPRLGYDFTIGADVGFQASLLLDASLLQDIDTGTTCVHIYGDATTTPSRSSVVAGEEVTLTANTAITSRSVWPYPCVPCVIDGGHLHVAGSLRAGASFRAPLLLETGTLSQPALEGSFDYTMSSGDGSLRELEGTGISFGVYRRVLPWFHEGEIRQWWLPNLNTTEFTVLQQSEPVYEIEGDLDKMMLILIGKYNRRRNSTLAERIDTWLNYCDDGLSVTVTSGSSEITVQYVDDELHLEAVAEREVTVGQATFSALYRFSEPVEATKGVRSCSLTFSSHQFALRYD